MTMTKDGDDLQAGDRVQMPETQTGSSRRGQSGTIVEEVSDRVVMVQWDRDGQSRPTYRRLLTKIGTTPAVPAPAADFNPGEGWHEVAERVFEDSGQERVTHRVGEGPLRVWVREEPVPPLPTEPYTVIRVTRRDGSTARRLLDEYGYWDDESAGSLYARITGFEVLASPLSQRTMDQLDADRERVRRETVKAVLDRLFNGLIDPDVAVQVAREFGVTP